jgi:hypothetical protein
MAGGPKRKPMDGIKILFAILLSLRRAVRAKHVHVMNSSPMDEQTKASRL